MKRVVFACVHSAGRSQMAAAWFNALVAPGAAHAFAAGTQPAAAVHPIVVDAMREVGIDLTDAKPRLLTEELVAAAAYLVTMGCGEACPVAPEETIHLAWELEDPKGRPLAEVRVVRDDIRRRVEALLAREGWSRAST